MTPAIKDSAYDGSLTLTLRGVSGLLSGETYPVRLGQTVVVGRSRFADFSLKKTKHFLLHPDRRSIANGEAFRSVSRRHLRVSFVNEAMVEIVNMGKNGTEVDGKRIDRLVVLDLPIRSREVDLGGDQRFEIAWGD